jgi:hypothetical protein
MHILQSEQQHHQRRADAPRVLAYIGGDGTGVPGCAGNGAGGAPSATPRWRIRASSLSLSARLGSSCGSTTAGASWAEGSDCEVSVLGARSEGG